MKKILFATALIGFAVAQTNAQNPAVVSTTKESPSNVQVADPALPAAKPATQAASEPAKPAAKPATVRAGKPALGSAAVKEKKAVKETKEVAKPVTPGTDSQK